MHWTIFQFVNTRQISMLTKISANNYCTLDFMKIEKLFLLGVAMRRLLEGFFDVSKLICKVWVWKRKTYQVQI